MADLGQIDRELSALSGEGGASGTDVRALLARYGERDLSLAHVDRLLAELAIGVAVPKAVAAAPALKIAPAPPKAPPQISIAPAVPAPALKGSAPRMTAPPRVSAPPLLSAPAAAPRVELKATPERRARGPRDTLVESVAPPAPRPRLDEADLEAETAALLGGGADPASDAKTGLTTPATSGAALDGFAMAELDDESSVFSRDDLATMDGAEISELLQRASRPPGPPQLAPTPTVPDQLLERRLDPDDFPQTPADALDPLGALDASPGADEDQDFELLVEDDDIIEIDGDELELVDDE